MRFTEVEWEPFCIWQSTADLTSVIQSEDCQKTMDAPAPVHLKEMYKVIRHVLSTKGYGLKFE